MSTPDVVVPEAYAGSETVRIAKGPDGPRDYVPGRGADYVPSRTGPGDVYFVDEKFAGEALTFAGLNAEGKSSLLVAAQQLVMAGQKLTHENVLQALVERETM